MIFKIKIQNLNRVLNNYINWDKKKKKQPKILFKIYPLPIWTC